MQPVHPRDLVLLKLYQSQWIYFATVSMLCVFLQRKSKQLQVSARLVTSLESCRLYNDLLTVDTTTGYMATLTKYLLRQEMEQLVSIVIPRVREENHQDVVKFSQKGWKHRIISTLFANWAYLKHPLLCSFTALEVSETTPMSIMFNMKQFKEPSFCANMYFGFYVSRFERVRVRNEMLKKYFKMPGF